MYAQKGILKKTDLPLNVCCFSLCLLSRATCRRTKRQTHQSWYFLKGRVSILIIFYRPHYFFGKMFYLPCNVKSPSWMSWRLGLASIQQGRRNQGGLACVAALGVGNRWGRGASRLQLPSYYLHRPKTQTNKKDKQTKIGGLLMTIFYCSESKSKL